MWNTDLYVVVPVVVEVEDAVDLGVQADVDVLRPGDALAQRLARVLLHLDVVELPATKKKGRFNFGERRRRKRALFATRARLS